MSLPESAQIVFRTASQKAEEAAKHADRAIELIEAELPPDPLRWRGVSYGSEPKPPWTQETARLRGLLTSMRSARTRQRKLSAEFERLSQGRS